MSTFHRTVNQSIPENLLPISHKIERGERITTQDALLLYQCNDISLLGYWAGLVRRRINDDRVYYNRNFHMEPTNICVNHCKFCSYRRNEDQKSAWALSVDEMTQEVMARAKGKATEIHIVGGVHPNRDVKFYVELLQNIRAIAPHLHIKGFTAVEIDQMCKMGNVTAEEGLALLKAAGLQSMPGGGAEIFDEETRLKICPDKADATRWLEIHRAAHKNDIPTNCTMLYGLIETYAHRVDHMDLLRKLQDETHGFNVFIPLKFRHYNNAFAHVPESTTIEDMKNFAVARIFLDNIPHLKAYWPMLGKEAAQLSLGFGVDDLDGTIDDSTRIYSMAGASDQNPSASTKELETLIESAGFTPVERDTLFNPIQQ